MHVYTLLMDILKVWKSVFSESTGQKVLLIAETPSCVFTSQISVIERAIRFVVITHQLAATKGFSFNMTMLICNPSSFLKAVVICENGFYFQEQ